MLITAALSLLVSSSPGVSAQRNITATPPPFDPLPEDPLPGELPTHVPTLSPTPTLIQPTTTPAPITPIPRPQSQDLIFAANVIDGQVSVTLYNPVGIEWVQVWVGTPDLDTLHLEWYDLAAATCTGTTCTLPLALTVGAGEYVVYVQPWGEAVGFVQNDLEGWLGPISVFSEQFSINPFASQSSQVLTANTVGELIGYMQNDCNDNAVTISLSFSSGGSYILTGVAELDQYGAPSGLPVVDCDLIIEGNGASIQRLQGQGPRFRILSVAAGRSLTLRNVNIQGGLLSQGGGAIFADEGSSLTLINTTIRDNEVTTDSGRGGGIYLFKANSLTLTNSVIHNNKTLSSRSHGGGIAFDGRFGVSRAVIQGSTISENSAAVDGGGLWFLYTFVDIDFTELKENISVSGSGSAIYMNSGCNGSLDGQPYTSGFNNSCITNNTNTFGDHAVYYTESGQTKLDATNNWWGASTLPANAVNDKVETDPILTQQPTTCGHSGGGTPTATPTPTANPDPEQAIIDELATYGIITWAAGLPTEQPVPGPGTNATSWQLDCNCARPWTLIELEQVLIGVQNTAAAFNSVQNGNTSGTSQQAKQLFRNIMASNNTDVLYMIRVNSNGGFTYNSGVGDSCIGTAGEGCVENSYSSIGFYGQFYEPEGSALFVENYIQHVVVHELGHRFDNQTGSVSVDLRVENRLTMNVIHPFYPDINQLNVALKGCGVDGVFGPVTQQDGTETNDDDTVLGYFFDGWTRGSRGWGTIAKPLSPTGQPEGQQELFQINPSNDPSEAAADMFLNWVYRRNTYGAPDWFVPENPQSRCNGPSDIGQWQGFRNIDQLGNLDTSLPGNTRYLWMDNFMGMIVNDNPNWTSEE